MPELTAPAEPDAESPTLIVPLRSDPSWLRWGLLATSLVCIGLAMLYFKTRPPPPHGDPTSVWLALIPGLAVATFAAALLAFVARRRGGTLHIEMHGRRLDLVAPSHRAEMMDLARPHGALLLHDTRTPRSILVLSQHGEPVMVMDPESSRAVIDGWAARTLDMDLSELALSPSTANMLTTVTGGSLVPLLRSLAPSLDDTNPWVFYPMPSGEPMEVFSVGVRVGEREAPARDGTVARALVIQTPQGSVSALSIVSDETSFLFARQDPTGALDATASDTPDAYLPPLVWAVLARLYHVREAQTVEPVPSPTKA